MKEFKHLVSKRIQETLNQLSYENDKYLITYDYLGYDEHKNENLSDLYYNMISVKVNVRNKLTGEQIQTCVDLLKMPVPTENGYKIGKGYKQIMDTTELSSGWFLLEPKKAVEDDNDNVKKENKAGLQYNSRLLRRRFYFFCNNGKIVFSMGKNAEKNVPVSYLLQALSGKSKEELVVLLGNNKYITNTFENEVSTDRAIEYVAESLKINTTDATTTSLYLELKNIFFRNDPYDKNGAGYARYCKRTSFSTRALNQILAKDIELLTEGGISCEIIPKGTELTAELLERIDADSRIDTLYVIQDGVVYCLKKYPAERGRLSVNELLTMINMYALLLSGYGTYDQLYDLTSRVITSYEDRVLNRLTVNIATLKTDILRELNKLEESTDYSENLIDSIVKIGAVNTDALVSSLKGTEGILQTTSDTNLLNLLSINSKIVSSYKGDAAKDEIGVQEHERNRNDPIDQPESSKIGKVHYPTLLVQSNEYGFQTAPYYKVVNGVPTDEIVYLSAAEEEGQYVACYEDDFSSDFVKAYLGGSVVDVPKTQVKYREVAPHQSIGVARSCIPFAEFNNSKRLLMGSNHQKQAVYITGNERPLVSTGTFGLLDAKPVTARAVLKDYYDLYKESLGCSEEEFCSLSLKLTGTTLLKEERILHLEILGSAKYNIDSVRSTPVNRVTNVRFAFMRSSDVKNVYSNEVIPKPDNIYKGDDLIYRNLNISTENPGTIECTDYGAFPPDSFDVDFALGKNLLVAYKTYEGKTIEDAITIRKSLCHTDLTSIAMNDFHYECFKDDGYEEEFGVCDGSIAPDYILPNGLPKPGTYLLPGDILMCKIRVNVETGERMQLVRSVDAATSGEVISTEIDSEKNVATVMLAKYNPIETGDKMSGRYGNKGVVAKVVPDEDMPYIEETGEIIDVILNPLGIPSRMNLGQALEIILGRAAQKEGKCCIVSPYNKHSLDFVKEMREKHKVYPQILVDGRTGQRFERPVEVGVEYMLTLHQKVKSKSKSVAITSAIDQSNGQPQDSTGAQAIGEMETWALEVAGCSKLLQDLFTFQSDDFHSAKNLKEQIGYFPEEISHLNGVNRNNIILQAVLMCMGILLKNNDDGDYVREILKDDDVRGLAPYALSTASKASLSDVNIFGDPNKQVYKRNDKFGYIELGCKIVNPYLVSILKVFEAIPVNVLTLTDDREVVEKKTILYSDLKNAIIEQERYVSDEVEEKTGLPIIYATSSANPDNASATTGIAGFVKLLERTDINEVIKFYEESRYLLSANPDQLNQLYECLVSWRDDGYNFKDFVISTYPVLPIAFRNSVVVKKQIHDFEYLYQNILASVERCKRSNDQYTVDSVYQSVAALIGISDKTNKIPLLKSYFGKGGDKKGKFRNQVLKKRVNFSGRSVIIPDDYRMPVTQIGVPISLAFTIWKLHLISLLRSNELLETFIPVNSQPNDLWYERLLTYLQTKNFYRFRDSLQEFTATRTVGLEEAKEVFQEVKNALIDFLETQKVIAGRQPTLHQYGVRSYDVKVVESRAIGINTLSCSGYNADFDGDTMYLIAILDKDTQEDTMKRLTMKQSIVNPKDGESVIKLTQDMLLGIYVATMLHNNVASIEEDERYKTIHSVPDVESLRLMVDLGDISVHDLVTVMVDAKPYISTAGRILFNDIMPDGFTDKPFSNPLQIPGIREEDGFCDLKYDGLISKKGSKGSSLPVYKSVSKITMDLYENYDIDTTFDVYQKMMEFGFVNSDKSGVTLGVTDFYSDLYNSTPGTVGKMGDGSVSKYKDIYREKELQINKAIAEGYISSDARSELLQGLGAALNQKVQKDANTNLPRNNNLFIISDSGAIGNAGQIGQTVGMAGTKMKTLTSSFDIPIMHSYAEGLTTYEMLMDIYAARQGVASTQLNTADAGFALRQMIYMTNAVQIEQDDCGAPPREFKVEYDNLIKIKKFKYSAKPDDFMCEDYSFKGELVQEFTDDLDVVIEKEILGHVAIAQTQKDFNYLENFLSLQMEFTQEAIDMVIKKHVHYVCCDEYIYEFDYNLTKFFKSYMLNRFIVSDDEELLATTVPDSEVQLNQTVPAQRGGYATEDTITYVEEHNLESVFMRTTLNCECGSGCCKKCYGLTYATKILPETGEMVGIESAQSIGEPVTQLTMSLFHKGGVAGGSVTNGVELNNSLLRGNLPKGDLKAKHAVMGSNVTVNKLGKVAIVNLHDNFNTSIRCSVDDLKVVDGEYVDQFDAITDGFTEYNTLGLINLKNISAEDVKNTCYIYETKDSAYAIVRLTNKGNIVFNIGADITPKVLMDSDNYVIESKDFKARQQMELLKLYNWNFSKEDIDVLPRHFELLVKVQTQTIKIVNTNLKDVKVNNLYSYIELKKKAIEEDGYFIYPLEVARQNEVVMLNSGPISSLVFIDINKNLKTLMSNRQLLEERGFVGKMTLGENLNKPGRKMLQNFSVYDKKTERLNVNEEIEQINQDLSGLTTMNVIDRDEVDEMSIFGADIFDVGNDLFNDAGFEDSAKPDPTEHSTVTEMEVETIIEDEAPEEDSAKPDVNTGTTRTMNLV